MSRPQPSETERTELVLTAPLMAGEYLMSDTLGALRSEVGQALAASGADLRSFLKTLNPGWTRWASCIAT